MSRAFRAGAGVRECTSPPVQRSGVDSSRSARTNKQQVPPRRANDRGRGHGRKIPPMTNENLQQTLDAEQARVILLNLARWLEVAPFRSVVVELVDGRWRATLATCMRAESANGATMNDALAQIATVAGVEVEDLPIDAINASRELAATFERFATMFELGEPPLDETTIASMERAVAEYFTGARELATKGTETK